MKSSYPENQAQSVCPECLERINAVKIHEGKCVYLEKTCPEHGTFRVKIWDGNPEYAGWERVKIPSAPSVCMTETSRGCPYDCGLCPDHRQHTCCVLLEVTERCNLMCPVCFADAGNAEYDDPDITEIEKWYGFLLESGGPFNIQLSGGEPTVRNDLPYIIKLGRNMGFSYIQLNTNGIRLAQEPGYARKLSTAGLGSVFLQFDGLDSKIHGAIRGRDLTDIKFRAIRNCSEAGIGIVLVPTLVPGINTDSIGNIIRFALENMPAVRGVHFQPISYFGRFPGSQTRRITIPEIIWEIERQTGGLMKMENFMPPGGENSYCSFHGNFMQMADGSIRAWSDQAAGCCSKPGTAAQGAVNKRNFVAKQWVAPSAFCGDRIGITGPDNQSSRKEINTDSIDIFLSRIKTHTISISCMAFQDAWNLELDRLRDCLVHVLSRDGRLIPFCAYNLTSRNGLSLYRKHAEKCLPVK